MQFLMQLVLIALLRPLPHAHKRYGGLTANMGCFHQLLVRGFRLDVRRNAQD